MRRSDHIIHGDIVFTNRNFREQLALKANANLNGGDVRQETVVESASMAHSPAIMVESHTRNNDDLNGRQIGYSITGRLKQIVARVLCERAGEGDNLERITLDTRQIDVVDAAQRVYEWPCGQFGWHGIVEENAMSPAEARQKKETIKDRNRLAVHIGERQR